MATRNRTALFRNYRDALRQVRVSSSSAFDASSGPVIELVNAPLLSQKSGYKPVSTVDADITRVGTVTVGLPPAWVDISEEISTDMQCARSKMTELLKVHAKALRPTFGDTGADQRTIEQLTQEITRLLKKCEKKLLQLSGNYLPSDDASLRINVQRSLATDLQSLSMEFRKQQKGYLQRLRQQQDVPTGADIGMGLNDRFGTADNGLYDMEFREQKMSHIRKNEAMTAEREKEVLQIVESVNDLAQIMKDLSVLVIDQGTIVDRIDYNIQNAAASVEAGVKQLEKAERTQKKGGMVLCIIILICLCLFMIFMLVIKYLLF
eukprot:c23536_g1_i1 orf=363-1325(-)